MNPLAFIKHAIRERLEDWRRERFIRECERLVTNMDSSREKRRAAFAMMAECIRERRVTR